MYSFALLAHIVGVTLLFAAVGVDLAVLGRLRRASTVAEARALSETGSSVSRLHGISGVLILLGGLYMAFTSWGFATPWIDVALVAYIIAAAAPEGPLSAGLRAKIHDPALVLTGAITTLWMGGFLYLMILKPGWTGSLVTMLVVTLIGYLVARRALRAGSRSTAAAVGTD